MTTDDFTTAAARVLAATEALAKAQAEVAAARSVETTCINRLNQAQKNLDDLVAGLKKNAPRDSDWRRPVGKGEAP
jgi:hypothetical protein